MQSLELLSELSGHQDRVWHLTWDIKGKRIASCGGDKTIRIWEEVNKTWICKAQLVEGHQRTIRKIAWSPCGKRIASASFDSTVGIWEKETEEFDCTATLEGHENEVKGVSWSISGSYLASCSRDKSVWVWDSYEEDFECAGVLTSHKQDVKDVKWSPTEDILASCSYDNTINLYEEDDGEWITSDTLNGHESTVWSISWHKSGNMLASASDDKTVKIWKRYKPNNSVGISMGGKKTVWKCICTLSGYHERAIYSIDWSPVNDMICTGGGDDCIRVFKYSKDSSSEDDDPVFELLCSVSNAHSQDINIVAWNPTDSNIIASASDDCAIKLWKILT